MTDYGADHLWSDIHRFSRAYAERIAAERIGPAAAWPRQGRMVPIVDFELSWSHFTFEGDPESWGIARPATAYTSAERVKAAAQPPWPRPYASVKPRDPKNKFETSQPTTARGITDGPA